MQPLKTTFRKFRSFVGAFIRRKKMQDALNTVLKSPASSHSILDWSRSLENPTEFYLDCVRFFYSSEFDQDLKNHRAFFSENRRGFGEAAFHVMWWMLFDKFHPATHLEIGVYRGQTLSLASLLQRKLHLSGSCTGISPFNSSGDTVSIYTKNVDYYKDTLNNFSRFGLPEPELIRAYSTDTKAIECIQSQEWDTIYIDGNHDYEIALADWGICSESIRTGGIIVLDDASLDTKYRAPLFATAGHPGPSRIANEIDALKFREILRVGHNRAFQKL